MKPYYILIAVLFLWVSPLRAQYISLYGGAAVPSGNFSNSNLSKPEDGFAQSGGAIGLGVNYHVYKNIGVCVKFNYSSFGFNITDYSAQVNDQAPQGTTQTVTSNGKYQSSSALAGGYLTLGKKKLTLDIHIAAGFVSLRSPALLSTSTYSGNSYTTTLESIKDVSPAIGYGFTVKYVLPKNFYATANIDNVNANMQFPKNRYQSNNEEIITKPYQAYSFTVGVGYGIQ